MVVSDVKVVETAQGCELQARVKFDTHWVWGDEPFLLWYRYPHEFKEHLQVGNGNPFLAALLAPAMLLGETLELPAPVSPRLLRSVEEIQHIYHCWNPNLTRITVKAVPREHAPRRSVSPPFSGLFFSLGVDFSYSLWKNVQEHPDDEEAVIHLVSVLGFDVYLWESERCKPMLEGLNHVAGEMNEKPLSVTTNLREVSDLLVALTQVYHGAALASVGLTLEGAFQMRIASSSTYAFLYPWGSHPVLDPLWSTESLAFMHDGCEADRLQKIRRIAESSVILNTLRVCTADDPRHVYNCGRCEKGLRTMVGLHIAGALKKATTFPQVIDLTLLRNVRIESLPQRYLYDQLISGLGLEAEDRAIRHELEQCLRNSHSQAEEAGPNRGAG